MSTLRNHMHQNSGLTAALAVAALLIMMLVPAGYMLRVTGGATLIQPCAAQEGPIATTGIAPSSDIHAHGDRKSDRDGDDYGQLEAPCIFSSLAASALGTTDPIPVAGRMTIFREAPVSRHSQAASGNDLHLRPPSQAPPR